MMLQKTWTMSITWDEEGISGLKEEFIECFRELNVLKEIEIPRYIQIIPDNLKNCGLYTFCDASKHVYAVMFLKMKIANQLKLFLHAVRSQIRPLKCAIIP